MKRIFSIFCMIVYAYSPVSASQAANGRLLADLHQSLGEARLNLGWSMLQFASREIGAQDFWHPKDGHLALKYIAEGQEVARSILVLDRSGELLFDSYNRRRFFSSDLSDRNYFLDGWGAPLGKPTVHDPVVGKQSGLGFIPVTLKVMAAEPVNEKLLMMTLIPEALIPDVKICSSCGFIVLKDRKVLAASHAMSTANEDIASRLRFEGAYGQMQIEVRGIPLSVHWRKSSKFELDFVYYSPLEGFPDE